MQWNRVVRVGALALAPAALIACEDEITNPEDQFIEGQIVLDASSPVAFTHFTFADGGSIVPVTDPASSTDWDMAFRRFGVKLNGGVAGPGTVAGANLANNASATDAEVVLFTPSGAAAAFEAVTAADISGATFLEEGMCTTNTRSRGFRAGRQTRERQGTLSLACFLSPACVTGTCLLALK